MRRVPGTAREINDRADTKPLRQQDRFAADLPCLTSQSWIWMKRVSVAAKSADGRSAVCQTALELLQLVWLIQHRKVAMRATGIIAGP